MTEPEFELNEKGEISKITITSSGSDWDKIKDNEDCLVTKDLVEMVHHWDYQRYCKEND